MRHKIIAIGRQFGSGGHEIGDRLSKSLAIPLYDRNLIEMASEKMGISELSVEEVDESVLNTFLSAYSYPEHVNSFTGYGLPLNDSIYLAQSSIIESLAKRGPCIIIGRCADFVLRQYSNCLTIFLCASMKDRLNKIMKRYNFTEKEAAAAIRRTDRRRKNYYEAYTDQNWGGTDSHQLLINVSRLGMDRTIDLIEYLYKQP